MISTDDLADIPHVVIVETGNDLFIVEFDAGRMLAAHEFAQDLAMRPGFDGRIIVTARVRQMGRLKAIR